MIKVIDGPLYAAHSDLLDQMFKLRKHVFKDRLQWDVNTLGSYEIDDFDMLKPLYVLAMDESGKRVVGSLRLLPTTGPNMLANVFSDLLPENEKVCSPTIWESSRFCVDTDLAESLGERGFSYTTAELLLALCEIGMQLGTSFIVTVIDLRMERILRRLKCMGERIGEPVKYGNVTAVAGLWETTEEMLHELQQSSGIKQSVLEPNAIFGECVEAGAEADALIRARLEKKLVA